MLDKRAAAELIDAVAELGTISSETLRQLVQIHERDTVALASLEHTGSVESLDQTAEECLEVALSVRKLHRERSNRRIEELAAELADATIMLSQAWQSKLRPLIEKHHRIKLRRRMAELQTLGAWKDDEQ